MLQNLNPELLGPDDGDDGTSVARVPRMTGVPVIYSAVLISFRTSLKPGPFTWLASSRG